MCRGFSTTSTKHQKLMTRPYFAMSLLTRTAFSVEDLYIALYGCGRPLPTIHVPWFFQHFEQNRWCPSHVLKLGVVNSSQLEPRSCQQAAELYSLGRDYLQAHRRLTQISMRRGVGAFGQGVEHWDGAVNQASLGERLLLKPNKKHRIVPIPFGWWVPSMSGLEEDGGYWNRSFMHLVVHVFCRVGTTEMKLITCTRLEHTEAWHEQLHRIKMWRPLDWFVCDILT